MCRAHPGPGSYPIQAETRLKQTGAGPPRFYSAGRISVEIGKSGESRAGYPLKAVPVPRQGRLPRYSIRATAAARPIPAAQGGRISVSRRQSAPFRRLLFANAERSKARTRPRASSGGQRRSTTSRDRRTAAPTAMGGRRPVSGPLHRAMDSPATARRTPLDRASLTSSVVSVGDIPLPHRERRKFNRSCLCASGKSLYLVTTRVASD